MKIDSRWRPWNASWADRSNFIRDLNMRSRPIIAIDGPSGAGKTTIARGVARELGFTYIDTGAMYRCVALAADRSGLPAAESLSLISLLEAIHIEFRAAPSGQAVFLNDENVSEAIRRHDISGLASSFSTLPAVRAKLVTMQRDLAGDGGIVMEGRDIGTNVFPDAELKVFLTASPEERARRRCEELKYKGQRVAYDKILEDQRARDLSDSTRSINPLIQAPDAWLLNTDGLSIEEIIGRIAVKVRKIMGRS
jgi:CMP/dCMP kinase